MFTGISHFNPVEFYKNNKLYYKYSIIIVLIISISIFIFSNAFLTNDYNTWFVIFLCMPMFAVCDMLIIQSNFDTKKLAIHAAIWSSIIFLCSFFFLIAYDLETITINDKSNVFQYTTIIDGRVDILPYIATETVSKWIGIKYSYWVNFCRSIFNFYFCIGVDTISLFFIILTTFITFICTLIVWTNANESPFQYDLKLFYILLFATEFFLFQCFVALDIFQFLIFFEIVAIPIFLMIGKWGSRERRIQAAYRFLLYTVVGSLPMLIAYIVFFKYAGYTSWFNLIAKTNQSERVLYQGYIITISSFIAMMVKLPLVPVHTWLPEAHVEASTPGSVFLAAILLKLGGYGIFRWILPIYINVNIICSTAFMSLATVGAIIACLTTIRQNDLKKVIAYSSIIHMSIVSIGLFSQTVPAILGSVFMMISHGIVSSGLFICVGFLYERVKTRAVESYGGLVSSMPIFSSFFVLFNLANMALPLTIGFPGEFLIFTGLFGSHTLILFLSVISTIFNGIYSIWMVNRVCFGVPKQIAQQSQIDLNFRETFILSTLALLTIIMGVKPSLFIQYLLPSIFCEINIISQKII